MTDDADARGFPLQEGDLLAGKYRIAKILGIGGMGTVVAAHHIHLDEKVAIKVLLAEIVSNHEAITRFAREARAAAKIKSEHVARVIDVGSLESGAPYMVLEYLEGSDLEGVLAERGGLQVEEAVEYVLQACEAIAEAHALGIVHRDLKPANLFCARRADGTVTIKVLDFGISKLTSGSLSDQDMTITKTATMMGSPLYMSPEQLGSSRDVDARSDIWSLGVVLYELLAGTVPFSGASFSDLCVKIVTHPSPPIRGSKCQIPPSLERVIAKCLEKERQNRYANVAELAIDLAQFASVRGRFSVDRIVGVLRHPRIPAGEHAVASPVGSSASENSGADTVNPWGRTKPAPASRNNKALGVTISAFFLMSGAAAVALRWPKASGENEVASQLTAAAATSAIMPTRVSPPGSEQPVVTFESKQPELPAPLGSNAIRGNGILTQPQMTAHGSENNLKAKRDAKGSTSGVDPRRVSPQNVSGDSVDTRPTNVPATPAVQPAKRSVYDDRK
jgi:eukaryotic-like serine/threonine-protein kinase